MYIVKEETKMKYQVGDKVVLREDLDYLYDEELKEEYRVPKLSEVTDKPYVVIEDILKHNYIMSNNWAFPEEMIQGLYTVGEDRFLFRTEEVAGVSLFLRKGALLGEISHVGDIETLAESPDYLLTVEEAKQSPLYSSLIRIPLSEAIVPKYVLNKGDLYVGRLNSIKGPIVIGSDEELAGLDIVTEFTDTEVEDIQQIVADLTVNKA